MVQGPTDDGKKLADEIDIDEANSDSDEEEEKKRERQAQPFVPSYLRLLEQDSRQKRASKSITRTTRRELVLVQCGEPIVWYPRLALAQHELLVKANELKHRWSISTKHH